MNTSKSLSINAAEFSIKGKRDRMEDAICYHKWTLGTHYNDKLISVEIFGVFDGHGGTKASNTVSRILPTLIKQEFENPVTRYSILNKKHTRLALVSSFIKMQEFLEKTGPKFYLKQGTTVNIILLVHLEKSKRIYCANVGDSRSALYTYKTKKTSPLSLDHKPNLPSEKARITRNGGVVIREGKDIYRVWDSADKNKIGLSTSRSIGDLDSKMPNDYYLISPMPDVFSYDLLPNHHYGIVIGCDGVWDVITNEDISEIIPSIVTLPITIAQNIVETAYNQGSTDNITCIFIYI